MQNRAVGRSENSGVSVLFGGHNLPPLVDLPKSVGAMAPSAPPGTTGLISIISHIFVDWTTIYFFLHVHMSIENVKTIRLNKDKEKNMCQVLSVIFLSFLR